MKTIKEIVFDMDGTIADLYGVDEWLPKLRASDPTPYEVANPLWDMQELVDLLQTLQTLGVAIRIISWLSKDSTEEYKEEVRKAKREWLEKYNFPYDYCNMVAYGTKKQNCIRNKTIFENEYILIDDSNQVRDSWNIGRAINPTDTDIIEFLQEVIENEY